MRFPWSSSSTSQQSSTSISESQPPSNSGKFPRGIRAVIQGPPGAGKTTQAPFLVDRYRVCHLSIAHMLDQEMGDPNSQIGQKLMDQRKKYKLMGRQEWTELVEASLNRPECSNGFVFDGYPRTEEQAQNLDDVLERRATPLDAVIEFDIPNSQLPARISGRLHHPPSDRPYHTMFNPPKVEWVDDITGEPLLPRSDDNLPALRQRVDSYHSLCRPVMGYYKTKELHAQIDATYSIPEVRQNLQRMFDEILTKVSQQMKISTSS